MPCVYLFPGTHDIQGVSITSPYPGAIRIIGYFIQGSTATGVLTAILTTSRIYFHLLTRQGNQLRDEGTFSNVVDGDHYISVFVVDEDGLPFNRTATILPQVVSVANSKLSCMSNVSTY